MLAPGSLNGPVGGNETVAVDWTVLSDTVQGWAEPQDAEPIAQSPDVKLSEWVAMCEVGGATDAEGSSQGVLGGDTDD